MKISYATPAASPTYTELGDEANRSALFEAFVPAFQPLNQVDALAGGTNSFKAVRGNTSVQLQVVVSIPYSTTANALASINTLRSAFAVKKHLKVEQGATAHYYPHALLAGYQPQLTGVTVRHAFNFITHDLTTVAPTT